MTENRVADNDLPPILRELRRIFGDGPVESEDPRSYLALPLMGDDDALAFFRSVPAGTRWQDLLKLATQYRDAHPIVSKN